MTISLFLATVLGACVTFSITIAVLAVARIMREDEPAVVYLHPLDPEEKPKP
jgi:hypothetical protein